MDRIRQAVVGGAAAEDFAAPAIPKSYRAVTIDKDEELMFEGVPSKEKDPRASIHLDDIPVVLGGIIPDADPDADAMAPIELGIAAVFTPKDYDLAIVIGGVLDVIRSRNNLSPV